MFSRMIVIYLGSEFRGLWFLNALVTFVPRLELELPGGGVGGGLCSGH